MARHANQNLRYGRPLNAFNPKTRPELTEVAARATTLTADLAALDKVQATRQSKPPHRHQYERSVCRVCGQAEVEST